MDIPVQESVESHVAEPMPIISEESDVPFMEDNAVPIVKEPVSQENLAPEIEFFETYPIRKT